MPTPMFLHDCEGCVFLGNYSWKGKEYDLYVCKQGMNWPTVIARYASDGPDYISGLEVAVSIEKHPEMEFDNTYPLVEAMNRAKGRGLLTKKDLAVG